MTNFCFVSNAETSHCDFGGMSFIRTAQELRGRGHNVRWVFSPQEDRDIQSRAHQVVRKHEIDFEEFGNLVLSNDAAEVRANVEAFERYLRDSDHECLVVDRLCFVAAVAAHRAKLPWAAIGTDGGDWCFDAPSFLPDGLIASDTPSPNPAAPLLNDAFPKPSTVGHWATSPFLNISFFPKAQFQITPDASLPPHSHCVGSGPQPDTGGDRKHLLITFGNSFPSTLRNQLVRGLRPLLSKYAIPTLILAGTSTWVERIRAVLGGLPHVNIRDWMAYDEAFRDAGVVVGHGGLAHLWYGMRWGKPMLAIPFLGDQWYNAWQIERLNIGRSVPPFSPPPAARRLFQPRLQIDPEELGDALLDVIADTGAAERVQVLSHMMRSGGGVAAAASLLERLGRDGSPVVTCAGDPCCC